MLLIPVSTAWAFPGLTISEGMLLIPILHDCVDHRQYYFILHFIFILALLSYGKVEHHIIAIYCLDFYLLVHSLAWKLKSCSPSFPLGGGIVGCPPVPFPPVHFLDHTLIDIPMNSGFSHYKKNK